jgi:micrococcal nuclease
VRRVLLLVAVLALAGLAVWIVATGQNAVGDPPAPAGAGHPDAPADADSMEVVSITDGDTLRLRDATGAVENVRLIGIDTPEVYPVLECFGDEAEAELLRLAPIGSTLRVATDAEPFDDYDRLLLYLWTDDGTFVNLALVEGGFAEAIRVGANDSWYDELKGAERDADSAGLGMWSC